VLSLVLVATWLLVANTVTLGHLLLAAVLGLVIPWITWRFWPDRPRLARPGRIPAYVGRVLADIVVANFEVARQVLGPVGSLRPTFVEVPVDLADDFALTVFASTVSLTPGTVSADVSDDRRWLLVHALHADDPEEVARTVKARYEAPLKEIFGC
jgi:multicomponent K+:H+ antiporter subunit E